MNGRIQRWQLLGRCLLTLIVGGACWRAGSPLWGLVFAAAVLWFHGLVMGGLFALLLRVNRGDAAPSPWQLLRAWGGELWAVEKVFSWQQPFAAHRFADFLPQRITKDDGKRGVLFLHGYTCNRGLWNGWMQRLRALGHPHIALTLEPAYGSIDAYAEAIELAVQRLTQCTGQMPLIVAHSMGGLAARAWAATHGGWGRVQRIITLGTPHHGTLMARFAPTSNARQMQPQGEWLQRLRAVEPSQMGALFDCFYSACDHIVSPAMTAVLPGARAIPLSAVGHVAMVFHPAVFAEVTRQLALPQALSTPRRI